MSSVPGSRAKQRDTTRRHVPEGCAMAWAHDCQQMLSGCSTLIIGSLTKGHSSSKTKRKGQEAANRLRESRQGKFTRGSSSGHTVNDLPEMLGHHNSFGFCIFEYLVFIFKDLFLCYTYECFTCLDIMSSTRLQFSQKPEEGITSLATGVYEPL